MSRPGFYVMIDLAYGWECRPMICVGATGF